MTLLPLATAQQRKEVIAGADQEHNRTSLGTCHSESSGRAIQEC